MTPEEDRRANRFDTAPDVQAIATGVFNAFVKGHSAIVPVGSEWRGATKEAVPISMGAAPATATGGVTVTKTN